MGGKVRLTLDNNQILVSVIRGNGKPAETHPCTPIFGPDSNNLFGLTQHGNMRNEPCQVETQDNEVVITHNITDASDRYPSGVVAEQKLIVKDGVFSLTMTHTNTGKKEAPVNSGEHCYFNAPEGYKGTYINRINVTDLIENME